MTNSKLTVFHAAANGVSLPVHAVALCAALVLLPTTGIAGAKVSGTPDAVVVEAQNATIEEILAALGARFNVGYKSSANLTAKLSGTYQGSLRRVLTRILDGRDFVIKTNVGRLEVTVLGTGGALATRAQSGTEGPANGGPILQATPPPAAVTEQPGGAASDKAPAVPLPGMKLAEAPVPNSTAGPSTLPVPVPMPNSTAGAPPIPAPSASTTGPMPELRPSTAAPPLPPEGSIITVAPPLPGGAPQQPSNTPPQP